MAFYENENRLKSTLFDSPYHGGYEILEMPDEREIRRTVLSNFQISSKIFSLHTNAENTV